MLKQLFKILILFVFLFQGNLRAQTVVTYTTGTGTFSVPCGVTSLSVEVWGGGGGGGGDGTSGGNSGSGGGGGGYSYSVLTVAPGASLSYTVGAAGAGGGGDANGTAGGNSTFSTVVANGGGGGAFNGGAAGAGGTGTTTNGTNGTVGGATGGNGGTNTNGGAGGVGGSGIDGTAGTAPGGGGGGGNDQGGADNNGGAGGRGRVVVSYNVTSAGVDQTLSACATTANLNATAPSAGTGTWTCFSGCTGVSITTTTLNTSGITGLDPGTPSTFIWTVTNGGCTTTRDTVIVTSPNGVGCWDYCTPGQDGNYPIRNVTFGSINNSNTGTGTSWQDFTAQSTTVLQANTYTISVAGTGLSPNTFYVSVFFDWNNDGDYTDAGEEYQLGTSTATNYTITGNIAVPAGATLGTTNFIVYNQYNLYASACQASGSGQAESYSVIIDYVPGTCSDGILNNGETQIDCGGPNCSACPPTCTDGIQNQGESDVDCGGPCAPCAFTHPTTGISGTYVGDCMVNTCNGTYTDDNGGGGGFYSNNINNIYRVFCPNTPGMCMQMAFTSIDMNNGTCIPGNVPCDVLSIEDGSTQNNPLIAEVSYLLDGTTPTYTANNASGCITVQFRSTSTGNAAGWSANLSCVACAVVPQTETTNDCAYSTGVCNNATITATATGPGVSSESCTGCTAGGENYTLWYDIQISASGTMGFTIDPAQGNDDFDFALYGPNTTCGTLGSPVRCSYSAAVNNTGMGNGASDASEGVSGDGWVSTLAVTAGQTYQLMVNHWTPPGATQGFSLTWDLTGGASLDCIVLPAEITDFNLKPLVDAVEVNWNTSAEINNDYFTVEKSVDGNNFEKCGVVDAAGNSSKIRNYSFLDTQPYKGFSYYRLRQTDFNGKDHFSILKQVNFEGEINYFSVKPNPTNSNATLTYSCNELEEATVRVIDVNGVVVYADKFSCSQGENATEIKLSELSSGLYLVTLTTKNHVYKTKLVKQD